MFISERSNHIFLINIFSHFIVNSATIVSTLLLQKLYTVFLIPQQCISLLVPNNYWTTKFSTRQNHDDVIKWKHFPRYWPFVRGIHRRIPGEFPAQRPVKRSFDVFFDLCLNKRVSKQSRGWWFRTSSRPLWRQCNVTLIYTTIPITTGFNVLLVNTVTIQSTLTP